MSTSDDRALAIDEEQYGSESGPCLSAMREREIVDVPDYTTDQRWPHVTAKGRSVGVYSGLSLPVEDGGKVQGSLNLHGDTLAPIDDAPPLAPRRVCLQASCVLR